MKRLIFLLMFLAGTTYCGRPVRITANPDDHTATSGTLGSARSTNQLPPKPVDTSKGLDSLRIVRDSLRKNN